MPAIEVEFRRQTESASASAAADLADDDDWPTTQRFSRHAGDTVRGADYAAAIEGPRESRVAVRVVVIAVVAALLGAVAILLWHTE